MQQAAALSLGQRYAALSRFTVLIAFAVIAAIFAALAPAFLSAQNLVGVLVNNVAMLAIVSLGMTIVIGAGGIDLSVGTAIDLASLAFISTAAAGSALGVSLLAALGAAACVGLFNAVLISIFRITPFLATLGTLFIGQSLQQLTTGGGQPIYLVSTPAAAAFSFIGHGSVAAVPIPLLITLACVVFMHLLLQHTRFGRHVTALGAQPAVALYSGLRVSRGTGIVYILSAVLCGITGIILSCTVRSYVPLSGNAFLLDAIGATFIGTTIHPEGRASALGTLLGVLLLGFVKNGLLLVGMNFYWQQVGTGLLIFAVLALSFTTRRLRSRV